jgi:toxin-antitoxin system PIN domain toxin
VIAVDTNVLVYAHREDMAQHPRGLQALTALAEGAQPWALPVFVINEFLRVVTHRRVFAVPSTRSQATAAVQALLESPTVQMLRPGPRFWPLLTDTLDDGDAKGDVVLDAAIVAVCREHGANTVLTMDRDFRRFSQISVRTM